MNRFSTEQLVNKIVAWGSKILFIVGIIILSYLSFVENFDINLSIRNVTTIALIAMVLNYLVWDSNYQSNYSKVLNQDAVNKDYSIHKRYYFARKGWEHTKLQERIRKYNKDFVTAWIQDVEDITGRTEKQIIEGPYFRNHHKLLIWRIKRRKYPKSGIRTARSLLYVLSVGNSGSMRIDVRKAERYHSLNRFKKIITSSLSTLLVASLVYDFISGDWDAAILKLIINIALLFMSLFFGTIGGVKGAQIKLSTAEEICEKLEEWKNEPATEVPFKEELIVVPEIKEEVVADTKTENIEEPEETIVAENKPQPEKVTIEIT